MHTPAPLQSFGQAERLHATPVYPSKHSQMPVLRSHTPAPEHSESEWAESVA